MHRVKRVSVRVVGWTCIAAAVGCAGVSDAPDVSYTDGTALGRWQTAATPASSNVSRGAAGSSAPLAPSLPAAGSLGAAPVSSTSPGVALPPTGASPTSNTPVARAGSGAVPMVGQGGQGAAGRAAVGGDAGAGAKPPLAGAPAGEPAQGAITSLAFAVTTAPVGLRYQPKNIGAIWIEDDSGTFVKSLKVWARVRARYLTTYNTARTGQAVDVTASATLSSHQTHTVSWDLKGRSGAPVPPGKYSVCTELTDGDATGKSTCVDFDTSAPPSTSNPPDAASFKSMKLELK